MGGRGCREPEGDEFRRRPASGKGAVAASMEDKGKNERGKGCHRWLVIDGFEIASAATVMAQIDGRHGRHRRRNNQEQDEH